MTTEKSQRIFILRHGQSEANVQGLIVSSLANGAAKYGLTELGRVQAAAAGKKLKEILNVCPQAVFLFSPFLRTKETAEIAAAQLSSTALRNESRLVERGFGAFELTNHANYSEVWKDDAAGGNRFGIESVSSVSERMIAAVKDACRLYRSCPLILVSHGDPLQTLEAIVSGRDPKTSSSHSYLETGQVRELPDVSRILK